MAELVPSRRHDYPLVAVEPDLFAVRPPETKTWVPVTIDSLPMGESACTSGRGPTPRRANQGSSGFVSRTEGRCHSRRLHSPMLREAESARSREPVLRSRASTRRLCPPRGRQRFSCGWPHRSNVRSNPAPNSRGWHGSRDQPRIAAGSRRKRLVSGRGAFSFAIRSARRRSSPPRITLCAKNRKRLGAGFGARPIKRVPEVAEAYMLRFAAPLAETTMASPAIGGNLME